MFFAIGCASGRTDSIAADAGDDAPSSEAASEAGGDSGIAAPLPALPLRSDGRWILDANGRRFKLASVSWYGFESPDFVAAGLDHASIDTIARQVRTLGFNAVRLPFSNQLVETNPAVDVARLSANPQLAGLHGLELLDRVIDALCRQGLVIILDNHTSHADWCCSINDGNGLWFSIMYPESAWLADWRAIATRYLGQPAVVGVELRNEVRQDVAGAPVWGGDSALDWKAAARRGADAVLGVNANLLVAVDGLDFSTDFGGAYSDPLVLGVADRLVWAPHDYSWFHSGVEDYSDVKTWISNRWGFLLVQGQPYTAPVWLSEFGTCNTSTSCVSDVTGQGEWFQSILQVLADADIDWSYWPLNGTEASGTTRTFGAAETYGVLDPTWSGPSSAPLLQALQAHQPITQHP